MIKLQVIGNLGNDAVVNNVNGKNVINFSVAHTEKYKDAQGNQLDRTIWVNCAYWTDRLGVQPYLLKGKTVYVEGTPSLEIYTTNDGRQNPKLKLNVREIQLLGGTGTGAPRTEGVPAQAPSNNAPAPSAMDNNSNNNFSISGGANDGMNEDLPF
jgi:single-strand DNA-binding protein